MHLGLSPRGHGDHHRSPGALTCMSALTLTGVISVPVAAARTPELWASSTSTAVSLAVVAALVMLMLHVFMDSVTEIRESHVVSGAEQRLWKMVEQDVYAGAELVEVRPNRRLCVIVRKAAREDAPVVFFVHGSMARLSQFKHQLEYFSRQGATVVAYDYFGMGRSPKPRGAHHYSTGSHLDDLVGLYARFSSRSGTNWVVGHSFGCSLTLRLAMTAPSAGLPPPQGLALLGGGVVDTAKRAKVKRLFRLPLYALRLLHPVLSKGFRNRALHPNTLTSTEAHHVELLKVANAANGANPFHVTAPFYVGSVDTQPEEVKGKVTQPVLMIVGEADGLISVDAAKELQSTALPHATLEVVRQASHQVMMEQPAAVNALLHQFVFGHPQ